MADEITFTYPVTDVAASPGPTPSQTVGPFFGFGLPYRSGPDVAGPDRDGSVVLSGRVLDGAGHPIPDAMVEIWQADEHGQIPRDAGVHTDTGRSGFRGFGRCPTDDAGRYRFRTVRPGPLSTPDNAEPAPYVAMLVFARGMLRQVATRVYLPDNPDANAADPLLASLPAGRRHTLVAETTQKGYRFDVHLQGESETVFLDAFAR